MGPLWLAKYDRPGPNNGVNGPQGDPCQCNACDHFRVWSLHPNGAQWAMVDGSVKFIPWQYTTAGRFAIKSLATRAGGEGMDDSVLDVW